MIDELDSGIPYIPRILLIYSSLISRICENICFENFPYFMNLKLPLVATLPFPTKCISSIFYSSDIQLGSVCADYKLKMRLSALPCKGAIFLVVKSRIFMIQYILNKSSQVLLVIILAQESTSNKATRFKKLKRISTLNKMLIS